MALREFPYHQKSLRLANYDYSNEGVYFITIITKNRNKYFAEIIDGKLSLTKLGEVVKSEWLKTEQIRKEAVLGNFIIMPDHFHALVAFRSDTELQQRFGSVKTHGHASLLTPGYKNKFGPQSRNLSALVRSFKAACTSKIRNELNKNFGWHRSFHDRIVRDQHELEKIENYIIDNQHRLINKNSYIYSE